MALNIIRSRLAKGIRIKYPTSLNAQQRNPERLRKTSYSRGIIQFPIKLNFLVTVQQNARLEALAANLRIKKGLIMRDALDFYLGMAEQEVQNSERLSEKDIIDTTLAPDKIRRPDGAIVLITEVDPGGKRPEIQEQKYAKATK